jgi:hypothetical protein
MQALSFKGKMALRLQPRGGVQRGVSFFFLGIDRIVRGVRVLRPGRARPAPTDTLTREGARPVEPTAWIVGVAWIEPIRRAGPDECSEASLRLLGCDAPRLPILGEPSVRRSSLRDCVRLAAIPIPPLLPRTAETSYRVVDLAVTTP